MKDFYDDKIYKCDCDDCCCDDVEVVLEAELIGEAVSEIFEALPCPHCVADVVSQLCYKFKSIGWDNCKDTIQSVFDEF